MNIFKKYNKDLKRIGALVLTAAMAVGGVPEFGVMDARAAVLEENAVGKKGSNENTGYKVNDATVGNGKFFLSMKNNSSDDSGYSEDAMKYRTTYEQRGFTTSYSFYKPEDAYTASDDSVPISTKRMISPHIHYDANNVPIKAEGPTGLTSTTVKIYNADNGKVSVVNNPENSLKQVEVRRTLSPSDDGKYLILEYKVFNLSNDRQDFVIGHSADLALIGHDNGAIVVTAQDNTQNTGYQGVHLHATGGHPNAPASERLLNGHQFSTLDIYTDMPKANAKYGLGIDRRDDFDKSRLAVWAGDLTKAYSGGGTSGSANFRFAKLDREMIMEDGDTAVGFSAYFDLNPKEVKTARFAIAAKEHVYYVNGAENSSTNAQVIGADTGYMASPIVKVGTKSSIQRAIDKTRSSSTDIVNNVEVAADNGGLSNNIYIMLQSDEVIDETITIPAGHTVRLLTADYKTPTSRRPDHPEYDSMGGANMEYRPGDKTPQPVSSNDGINRDGLFSLTRAANFTGPLFKVENGATLDLSNIYIDGNKYVIEANNANVVDANGELVPGRTEADIVYVDSPLIENHGTLVIGSGTTLQNADTSYTRSMVRTKTTYITQTTSTDPATGATVVNNVENDGYTYLDRPNDAHLTKASAIYSTGKVTFKGGTIRNNISAGGSNEATNTYNTALANKAVRASGAVVIDNAAQDAVVLDGNSEISITENYAVRYRFSQRTNPNNNTVSTLEMSRVSDGASNLFLRNNDAVVRVDNTGNTLNTNTKIGLKINNPPGSEDTGRLVVQMQNDSAMTFAVRNFEADAGASQLLRMGQVGHTHSAPSSAVGQTENPKKLYVKRLFSTITYNFVDENGSPIASMPSVTTKHGNGSTVERTFGAVPNQKIDSVTVTPSGTEHTLSSDKTKLTVTNLSGNVIVNVRYAKTSAKYTFDLMLNSGGETTYSNISNITTTTADGDLKKYEELVNTSATSSTISVPAPSRSGYTFVGWKEYKNVSAPPATTVDKAFNPRAVGGNGPDEIVGGSAEPNASLTILPPTVERDQYYYAVWKQNILNVPLTQKITNNNPSLVINFKTDQSGAPAGSALTLSLPFIPGYLHHANTVGKRIESTSFGTSNVSSLGVDLGYQFTGTMPSSSASLTFKYDVDVAKKKKFTVLYKDEQGNLLNRADSTPYSTETEVSAETLISAQKQTIPGYTYNSMQIHSGRVSRPAEYILGLDSVGMLKRLNDGQNGTSNTGEFEAYMPNQDVEVWYIYSDDNPSKPYRKIVIDDATHADNGKTLFVDKMTTTPGPNYPIPTETMYHQFYGLTYSGVVDLSTTGAVVDAQGNVGAYTQSSGGTLVLGAKKGSEWNTLKFGFVNNGFESHANMQYPIPGSESMSILTTDGTTLGNSKAMKFGKIRLDAAFPSAVAHNYYMFDGWHKDAAGTTKMQDADLFAKNSTAPFEHVVYAKIIEDPSKWVDVNFVTSDPALGTLSPVTTEGIYIPGSLAQHLHFDAVWNTVTKPVATPIANYELKGWIAPDGTNVTDTSVIQAGTYTAVFGKKDATWGLGVGAFGATGSIGSDGSGTVTVTGVTPGNVYVVTDPDGNIVGVATGTSGDLNFPGLVPGRTYNVVEGTPDTVAEVGRPASSITGSNVSAPKPVIIPAIGDNKSVGVDPKNPERAQIVVNPADPDAEYALIDSNGNVVPYPSSNGGWMTPVGSGPATVTFNDLDPGETYTVVARKKGNASETPLGNLHAGVPVVANPGSMVEAQNYIIETKTNGVNANVKVAMVAGENVNNTIYTETKANSTFSIHADPTDSAGNPFMHWVIMNGRIPGVSGKILSAEYSGKIAQSNVILNAVYDVKPRNASGELIAPVEQGNRGNAAEGEFALDPETIAQLEQELSKPTDVSLININGADVRYKVLFDKRTTKSTESNLIKDVPSSVWTNYPDAFTTAWSLDVKEERYVDGRLVQNATPSNASLKLVVQLEGQDADMLDYEIWDMGRRVDDSWNPVTPTLVSQVHFTEDVANNAGYMSFMGNVNHTYVLVYSKTFKLYFIDNNPTLDHRYLGDTDRNFFKKMKVRRKHVVTSLEYAADYRDVTDYADQGVAHLLVSPFDDIYGVTHTYDNWSLRDMPASIRVFDPENEVTRTQSVFAFYNNNRAEVTKARTDLTNLIPVAVNLKSSPYLSESDVNELNDAIAEAQNVLDRIRGRLENGVDPLRMANYPELQTAIDALQRVIDRMNAKINAQNARYISRTGGSSGGGSGSSGRGGGGSIGTPLDGTNYKNLPLSADRQNTFTLGVDGRWTINPMTGRWAFSLNGGLPLNDKWARIDYTDATGAQVTDWYRFDLQSSMATGWFYDNEYKGWYYLNPAGGKDIGKMVRGWHKDENTNKWYYLNKEWGSMQTGWHNDSDDGRWYYLDPTSGEMAIGWHFINGKWYFFNMVNSAPTWALVDGKWVYGNSNIRPYGAMYVNEVTPDGYRVDANGAWIP